MFLCKTFCVHRSTPRVLPRVKLEESDLGKDIGSARAAANIHSLSLEGPAVKDPENQGFLKRI